MPRTVEEWIATHDDQAIPERVRLRVWERCEGKCHRCHRKIRAGERWTLEHLIALINGGKHRESNFSLTCDWCLPAKNAEDVAQKSKNARVRSKAIGNHKSNRPLGRGNNQHRATTPLTKRVGHFEEPTHG